MAAIPKQTLTIRDPGLGLVPEASSTFVFFGTSSAGTNNAITYFSSKSQVLETLGQGPLPEALCHFLSVAGGPAIGIRLDKDVAATATAVTKTGTGTGTVTVAGTTANDAYNVIVRIATAGTVATGEFDYTLDGGKTYSPVLLIPAGGTYALPNTGVTITFVPGAGPNFFVVGDSHTFATTAPHYSTTSLAAGMTALKTATDECVALVLTGRAANVAAGATMFAAASTHLTDLQNQFRYVGLLMDSGATDVETAANVKTAYVASESSRIGVCYGTHTLASPKPFVGFGSPKRPVLDSVAAWAGALSISTHLGRFASGSLPGVSAVSYDEFKGGQGMSAAKFITLRSWPGAAGFYINRGNLRSFAGSDFQRWEHRRIMDVACDTTAKSLQPYMNTKIRVRKDGTGRIDPRDAERIEAKVNAALAERLTVPTDAEGNRGHVAAVAYTIDRENNIQLTGRVQGSVAVVPDGWAEEIATDIGFAAEAA